MVRNLSRAHLADLTAKVGHSTEVEPRLQYIIVKRSL